MNIKMKVNGKSEFNSGTTITTNIMLTPVNDSSSTVQVQGSLTLITTDQTFADNVNFRDVLELNVATGTEDSTTTKTTTA